MEDTSEAVEHLPDNRTTARLLWPELSGPRLIYLVALTVAVPALETVGTLLMGLFTVILLSPDAASGIPDYLGRTVGMRVLGANLPSAALVVAAVFLLRSAVSLLQTHAVQDFLRDYRRMLSSRLFRGYLAMPFESYLRDNTARLIMDVTLGGHQTAGVVVQSMIAIASDLFVVFVLLFLLIYIDPSASIVLVGVLAAAFAVAFRIAPAPISREQHQKEATMRVVKLAQIAFFGFREILVGGGGKYLASQFDHATGALMGMETRANMRTSIQRLVLENVALIALLAIVVFQNASRGAGQLIIIAIFIAAGYRLIPLLLRLSESYFIVAQALPKLRKLSSVLLAAPIASGEAQAAGRPPGGFMELTATGLAYRYDANPSATLSDVELTVRRGQRVGLTGLSGAGKTTLVNILVGLLPAQNGFVMVDGRPVEGEIGLLRLRALAAYVPQQVFIADDTALNNITLGVSPLEVDRKKLAEIVEDTQLSDFIGALPNGWNTVLGERGARLSGGEAQRIGIARALYLGRDLLVLDEATSSLDSDTEKRLLEALCRHENLTMIVISHRESALAHCDCVYRLANGQLRLSGIAEELL